MKPSTNIFTLLILFITIFNVIQNQAIKQNGWIETRKLFLFGADNGFKTSQFGEVHNFLFEREFDNVPRVGLAVYTIDYQYSPDFSCRITADTNKTATGIRIVTASQNTNNLLYVMYMATDHDQVGIFVPDRLFTNQLSLPTRKISFQNFNYNFKQQISSLTKDFNDISLTVYLTGISTTSQMTNNGYPSNRTSLSLKTSRSSTRFYTIQVIISQQYPQILIDWIQFTVVYFIPSVLLNNKYQANSGIVTQKSFGGTRQPVKQSGNFLPLQNNNKFQNFKFFFGINRVDCKNGASITILGVEKYFTGQEQSIFLSLQMETWKLTFIQIASYNYIQYKSLKCSEPNANCKQKCGDGVRPFFTIQNVCDYCHFSCLTCNTTKLNNFCDTCQKTRQKNQRTKLCDCKAEYYETFVNNSCLSCFPCATCQRKNACQTCLTGANMVLNSVKSQCQCKPSFFPNYLVNKTEYNQTQPCLGCSKNCLYCQSPKNCLACSMQTYLFNGTCTVNCNKNQKFNQNQKTCQQFIGDLFDQQGRLGFDWNLRYKENQMWIDLTFSQTDTTFYYFQNKKGYDRQDFMKQSSINSNGGSASTNPGSSIYYNDGIHQNGYGSNSSFNNAQPSNGSFPSMPNFIDQSALRGQYYGLGEATFFARLYEKYNVSFRDQHYIPYGKIQLSKSPPVIDPNFIEALAKNIVFTIGNQTIPFSIEGNSNNRFLLKARPSKTYINEIGAIQIKNPGLIRSNTTSLQITKVTKNIDRFDYYTGQQISQAKGIQSSNSFLVNILWGLSKYFLLIGFGWPFIPIMLAMQYIMSFNYINTNVPLNLDRFLSSFKDFRNPSILFNPQRNNFDASILTHSNMYKKIPQLQQFDRGLDFMKNSWQFFFVPMIAVGILGFFYLLNMLFRKFCRRDFCVISKFLIPRAPLLIAAYTLVQALPVSFFFFSQLKDTTFLHSLEPNRIYPTFNTAMAYLAFFLTCAIPILLLAWLYYHFNYGNRITKFSDANIFNKQFSNKIQNSTGKGSLAHLHNPLWGGDQTQIRTYILGVGMFILPVVFGFFLAYFINNFAWQVVGLIISSTLFIGYIIASKFIQDKIIKAFLVIFYIFIIGYLFLHAGLGSNRTMGTIQKWNIGYFGIGLIYALILTAILFTGYLLYLFFKNAYSNYNKHGCWINIDNQNGVADNKQVQRVQQYRRDTNLKSTFLKQKSGVYNNNQAGLLTNQNFINPNISINNKIVGGGNITLLDSDNLQSDQRLLQRKNNGHDFQQLIFNSQDKNKKQVIYFTKNTRMLYAFPENKVRNLLKIRQPLYVDGQNKIYDRNKQFIDYYFNLIKGEQPIKDKQYDKDLSLQNQMRNIQRIKSQKQKFMIRGQQYQKIGYQSNDEIILKNVMNGQINNFNLNNFERQAQNLFKYHSKKILNENLDENIYLNKGQILNNGGNIIQIQGVQYQQLGVDESGRHRLYCSQLKKHLLLTNNQYMKYRKTNSKESQNLMLQSAVGTVKKAPEQNQQIQMKLIDQNQQFFIFQQQNGGHLYIRKNIIDTELPIQIDQNQNIIQNGKIIATKGQIRNQKQQYLNLNEGIINIKKTVSYQSIQVSSRQDIINTISSQDKLKQQVSATDVINPYNYYTILGIPMQKVIDFQFKTNDIFLNETNIKGKQVMDKVKYIQEKHPQMSILVRGQSDQKQQYWLA